MMFEALFPDECSAKIVGSLSGGMAIIAIALAVYKVIFDQTEFRLNIIMNGFGVCAIPRGFQTLTIFGDETSARFKDLTLT